MEDLARTESTAATRSVQATAQTRLERGFAMLRSVVLRRTRRLVAQAGAARTSMGEGYGTDVTDLSSEEYKARIRQMMRG